MITHAPCYNALLQGTFYPIFANWPDYCRILLYLSLIFICILHILHLTIICLFMAKVWEWLWEESTNSLHSVLWQSLICGRGIPRLCVYGKHTHLDVLWGNRESHMLMLSYGTLNNLVVLWSCAMVVSCQRSQFSIWFRRPSPMCGRSREFFLSHDDQFLRDLYLYLCYLQTPWWFKVVLKRKSELRIIDSFAWFVSRT